MATDAFQALVVEQVERSIGGVTFSRLVKALTAEDGCEDCTSKKVRTALVKLLESDEVALVSTDPTR